MPEITARPVVLNIKKLQKYLTAVGQKQLPFATSVTINQLVFGAQESIRRGMYEKFTIRKEYVIRSVRVKKSNKRNLTGAVFHSGNYMIKQEIGGEHKAKRRRLAIPMEIRKRITQSIPKSRRPREIAKKANVFVFKHSIVQKKKKSEFKSRKQSKRFEDRFKILYYLRPSVRLKRRFKFREDVNSYVIRNVTKSFIQNITRAVKSAK